ncbi:hypothetical protein OEZ85_000500 [Tetradesmus obliquus]|uniref:Glycosyltransferase 61 catalytic domain-containing protein n=1 Tax=Tetradesmus obliquus TaxID=3088 RepID=A0ABY8UIE9_TETOB|nr:hypothetical protein OEZ85_000500 [Tetradesmus obliquus]
MPQAYAPCLNYTNLLRGEELVYPDYRIRLPLSVNQQHSDILTKFIKARFRVQGKWAYYLNQHGRNFVFANTSYQMNPPPHWANQCCMCEGKPAGHSQFTVPQAELPGDAGEVQDEVMFAASPDSSFFQHWRDRTALMLTQADHLLNPNTQFIASPAADETVTEHWQLINNITEDRLIPPQVLYARKFIYSCDTPLLHPYLVQRMSENMLAAAGIDAAGTPWDQRKAVLLIGRNKDAGVQNGHERRWNNYDQCKVKIEALLQRRGQGEKLVEWDLSSFSSLQDIMRFWNTQVRAAVGVHGSGLMNVHWASPGTILYEIWPVTPDKSATRGLNVFWEQAALKGASYYWFHAESQGEWNVDVDCDLLVEALNKGLRPDNPPMLEPFYQGTMWSTRR